MQRRCFSALLAAVLSLVVLPAGAQTRQAEDLKLSLAKDMMSDMVGGGIASIYERFTPQLKDDFTEHSLEVAWSRLLSITGPFQEQLSQSTRTIHGTKTYIARSQFEKSKVELRLTFTDQNQIARLWIGPISDLTSEAMESIANELVNLLSQGQFDEVSAYFSPDLQARKLPSLLEMSWSHVLSHLGQFKNMKLAVKDEEFDFVDATCAFEKGEAIIRVAFDATGAVDNIGILPVEIAPVNSPDL